MKILSSYPVICTENVREASSFYKDNFGFITAFDSDWYVSLKTSGDTLFELAFLDHNHPTIPEGFRKKTVGVIINLEVEDAEREYTRISERKLDIIQPLKEEDFGQKHFILMDPAGNLIDVIENTPPAEEYQEQFTE